MSSQIFLSVVGIALALNLLVDAWLRQRHLRYVKAHRGAVPASFASAVTLENHQKAADYVQAKADVTCWSTIADLAPAIWFIFLGGLVWVWQATDFISANIIAREVALAAALSAIGALIALPFDAYRTFVTEAKFGFNKTTPVLWAADVVKGTLLEAAIFLPFLALVFWLLRAAGEMWWVWTWVAFMTLQLSMLAIYPTFIAPLFNKFTPLPDGEVKTEIEKLLARTGFSARGLFVMDGSKRSAHGNAYFTGFGKSKRIVFFDTLLSRLTTPQIIAVLAHELGHFKRKHIVKRLVVFAIGSLAFLALAAWVMKQAWFAQAFGLPAAQFLAAPGIALIAFSLVFGPLFFLLTPLGAIYSRKHEFEADAYAAANANKQDLIDALGKLYSDNASTLTPDPLYSAYYDSHPPAPIRVAHLAAM